MMVTGRRKRNSRWIECARSGIASITAMRIFFISLRHIGLDSGMCNGGGVRGSCGCAELDIDKPAARDTQWITNACQALRSGNLQREPIDNESPSSNSRTPILQSQGQRRRAALYRPDREQRTKPWDQRHLTCAFVSGLFARTMHRSLRNTYGRLTTLWNVVNHYFDKLPCVDGSDASLSVAQESVIL